MGKTSASRFEAVAGSACLVGLLAGVLLFVGEVAGLPDLLWATALVLFVAGLLVAAVASGLASRASGRGWLTSMWAGIRSAFRFLFELLP